MKSQTSMKADDEGMLLVRSSRTVLVLISVHVDVAHGAEYGGGVPLIDVSSEHDHAIESSCEDNHRARNETQPFKRPRCLQARAAGQSARHLLLGASEEATAVEEASQHDAKHNNDHEKTCTQHL